MKKKTQKRFEIVKIYLLKIFDKGHHTYFNLQLSHEGFDELCQGLPKGLDNLLDSGYVKLTKRSDYDDVLPPPERVQKHTAELIQRDINVYWAVENIYIQKKITIEKAIGELIDNWPGKLGPYLGDEAVQEIYKNYRKIFRFVKGENPAREAAAFTLRQIKALTGRCPIDTPTGIYAEIHRMLELPFEKDIEDEIAIYQRIRNKAFGVTYIHPLRLRNESIGFVTGRFDYRAEKIGNAIKKISEKHGQDFNKLVTLYRHYRLIEAEANGQNQIMIYNQLKSDLKNIEQFFS